MSDIKGTTDDDTTTSPSVPGKWRGSCHKCGKPGHGEKSCWWNTAGGTLYIGDLPPSTTEDWVREVVGELGEFSYLRLGTNVKDGGKWAMVAMGSREGGQSVIAGLHLKEIKGREITVKWKEEGMWTCPDPACGKSNFDERDQCIRCKMLKSKISVKKM